MSLPSILLVVFFLGLASYYLTLGVVNMAFTVTATGLLSMTENTTFSDNEGVIANPSVPAAQPATLTTHSTNTTGSLTMTNSNHGITTGQRIDIYWTGGQCYGAVAGTVAGTTVPIASVSGGSNLPANSTPVTIGIATSVAFNVVGNNLQALACQGTVAGTTGLCYFVFNTGSADTYAALVQSGRIFLWRTGDVATNPLAGATDTTLWMSHNDTTVSNGSLKAAAVTH